MFYNFMDLGPIVLNYDKYSKDFQKLQPNHGGTINNSKNGQMVYILVLMLYMHFHNFFITWWLYLLHQFIWY